MGFGLQPIVAVPTPAFTAVPTCNGTPIQLGDSSDPTLNCGDTGDRQALGPLVTHG